MSVRRLNRVPIVILTGVENAGKTTLAQGLATALHWDLMPEAARSDRKVRDGTVNGEHLQHMLEGFSHRLSKLLTHAQNGIVCDTGGLVLDIWARHAFGEELTGVKTVMQRADLHMLCHTLPDWEPDPLRTPSAARRPPCTRVILQRAPQPRGHRVLRIGTHGAA